MFLLWLIEKKWEEIKSKFIEYQKSKVTKNRDHPLALRTSPGIPLFEKRTVIDTDIEASQTNFYEIKEEVTGIKKSRRFYKNYISRR